MSQTTDHYSATEELFVDRASEDVDAYRTRTAYIQHITTTFANDIANEVQVPIVQARTLARELAINVWDASHGN